LYVEEVVNAVWKNHQFMGMDLPECESIIDEALNFPNVFVPGAQLAKEAFALAAAANHPAYDMFYLALARREAAVLLTNDKALRRLAQRHGIQSV
jgi:predicted nucleic acid-binding protein